MKIRSDGLWAGSQDSYEKWVSIDEAINEKLAAYSPNQDEEEPDNPEILEIQGGVGVIAIKGPLTNRDSWLNEMMGVTSYGAIREALVFAAESPEVTQILLDIDSPGGAVSGALDTANLIKMVNDKVKPVTAFADGMMASAAYWLGSSAGEVYASQTANVGSIGVVATHMERSKMLKDAGIGVTVIRSGEFKALANGVEPLTEVAKAQLQSQIDAANKVFVSHVAEVRNVPYAYCDANMAQGREFFGQQALDAGLVDGITSYDALMADLLNKSIDTSKNSINNRGNSFQGGDMKRTLTPEQILAAAAEGVGITAGAPDAGLGDTAAIAAAAAQAQADLLAAESVAAERAAATALASAEALKPDAGVVAMLQTQLKDANAALMQANIDLAQAKGRYEAMLAEVTPMLNIAKNSVNNMRVALSMSALDMSAMLPASVLAEHASTSAMFKAQMPVGGVAAVDAVTEIPTQAAADPRHLARVHAALGTK